MSNPAAWFHSAVESSGIRVFPVAYGTTEPQMPYGIYTQEAVSPAVTLDAPPSDGTCPQTSNFSLVIWDRTYRGVWDVAGKVRKSLHGWAGVIEGVEIMHCLLASSQDAGIDYDDADEKPKYSVTQTYQILWSD